jgi:hypothetical protein
MPTQTIYRKLPVELSEEELAKRASELAAKELEKDRVEEQKKAVGAPIAGLKLAIRRLSQVVDTGVEEQEIPCDEIFDDDKMEVRLVRHDTGDEIHVRPYSSLEREAMVDRRQEKLPFQSEGVKEAKQHAKQLRQKTIFDQEVTVGPRDATPAPDRVSHNGQELQKVKRGAKKVGKGKSKKGEARP